MPPPTKITKKWYEVDKLEQETFPTTREYQVIIEREAIPIVFVPGIMGSRLYASSPDSKMIWDPDDEDVMKKNFLTWGGLGQKSPQERLDLLVGSRFDPNYLKVAGTADGKRLTSSGKFTGPLRKTIIQDTTEYWDWARRNQQVTKTDYFDDLQISGNNMRYSRSQTPLPAFAREVDPVTNEDLGTYSGYLHESELAAFNGWAGVSWSFYGQVLLRLATERWLEFEKCFYFPVYAFGYNWSDSNEKSGQELSTYVDNIITHERTREGQSNLCNFCILVTHSMGGLVARWATQQAGAKQKILGVIHGAQPVTGTPSAYHQFRAGEDVEAFWGNTSAWGTSRVIGSDAEHIDPIFGHCPGPLQLLPNQEYKTNVSNHKHPSSPKWLFQRDEQGRLIAELPGGDPYDGIYMDMNPFLGFGAQSPNVLAEGASSAEGGAVKGSAVHKPRSGQEVLLANLQLAKGFHHTLQLSCHPNTYYGYGIALGSKTYDEIEYSWKRNYVVRHSVFTGRGAVTVTDPGDSSLGQGVDYDKDQKAYFLIDPKAASGDGTVAASSSTALGKPGSRSHDTRGAHPEIGGAANDSIIRALPISNVEHSAYFKRGEALDFTVTAIRELAQNYLCKKLGKKQKLTPLPIPPF